MRWPETVLNDNLWKITKQQPIVIQIKRRKWRWIGNTIRKPIGSMEKSALDWNLRGPKGTAIPKRHGRGHSRK
jgi:hypothetical protein